jgi:hypothetical protein
MRECIDRCEECAGVCLETITYCLQQGGMHAEPEHIRLMMTCAEICRTSAYFMHAGSEFHARLCGVCAEVCKACEEDCERFGDDAMMRACADACRRCAESCREMARM